MFEVVQLKVTKNLRLLSFTFIKILTYHVRIKVLRCSYLNIGETITTTDTVKMIMELLYMYWQWCKPEIHSQ
jgi:hypothetical protein